VRIAIVGLGLIGGSIGLGLRRSYVRGQLSDVIVGIPRRKKTIAEAITLGAIDEGTLDIKEGVAGADVVLLCTPISLIIPKLKELVPALKKGAIVSDVGSVKSEIVAAAAALMPAGTFFVGGHPMAGKEQVKLEAAEADLLTDKVYILTETPQTNKPALKIMTEVVTALRGKVVKMDPMTHDLVVAAVSHAPLAIAAALVNSVAETSLAYPQVKSCAASGFKDTTRIASGDPVLGVDMFTANKLGVLASIGAFRVALGKLEKAIQAEDKAAISKLLAQAKNFRDDLYQ